MLGRLSGKRRRTYRVNQSQSSEPRDVVVRAVPIELSAFVKFGGLAESGGEAKQLVAEGSVEVNGVIETRKSKQLTVGDRVTIAGQTIVVRTSTER